jgi:hypothetical protein
VTFHAALRNAHAHNNVHAKPDGSAFGGDASGPSGLHYSVDYSAQVAGSPSSLLY